MYRIYKVIIKSRSWLISAYIFVTKFKSVWVNFLLDAVPISLLIMFQDVLDLIADEDNNSL